MSIKYGSFIMTYVQDEASNSSSRSSSSISIIDWMGSWIQSLVAVSEEWDKICAFDEPTAAYMFLKKHATLDNVIVYFDNDVSVAKEMNNVFELKQTYNKLDNKRITTEGLTITDKVMPLSITIHDSVIHSLKLSNSNVHMKLIFNKNPNWSPSSHNVFCNCVYNLGLTPVFAISQKPNTDRYFFAYDSAIIDAEIALLIMHNIIILKR